MKWILQRLTEPSTHAGLASIGTSGLLALGGQWEVAIAGLFGALAIIIGEKK